MGVVTTILLAWCGASVPLALAAGALLRHADQAAGYQIEAAGSLVDQRQ